MKYNSPKLYLVLGMFGSAINGSIMPTFAIAFAYYNELLSAPSGTYTNEYIEEKVKLYSAIMAILGVVSFIAMFGSKFCFTSLGENVTLHIRKVLYSTILNKHLGWFDLRDNAPSVLTSAMAEDTSLINGVGGESLGPTCEGIFAMIVGLALGFIYCWQESLVCLCVSPIMAIGGMMEIEFSKGLTEQSSDLQKEANLLCGDAIVNYKTVQSLGHEKELVKKFKEFHDPINT